MEVQRSAIFAILLVEEAMDEGVDGLVESLERVLDVGVVVREIAMTCVSYARL